MLYCTIQYVSYTIYCIICYTACYIIVQHVDSTLYTTIYHTLQLVDHPQRPAGGTRPRLGLEKGGPLNIEQTSTA